VYWTCPTSFAKRSHELLEWAANPGAQSDECVRTWAVSSPPTPASYCTLFLTIKAIQGGLITLILHQIARNADPKRERKDVDVSALGIVTHLRGVWEICQCQNPFQHVMAVVGCSGLHGPTPFLGHTRYVVNLAKRAYGVWDVVLVISTREPDIMLALLHNAVRAPRDPETDDRPPVDLMFAILLFYANFLTSLPSFPTFASLSLHHGRIDDSGIFLGSVDANHREPQTCGPLPFVFNAMTSLNAAGVDPERVRREVRILGHACPLSEIHAFAPVITANLIVAVLQETKCRRYPRSFSLNVIYSITDLSR
jgi:hypothetical protein